MKTWGVRFSPLSRWGGWMKTTCVNTAWCTALSASFREENQIGFLWQIITFVLNQQHFSQSEAVAPVVIGARLVSTPGGLRTIVTTFVPVWLRLAPMRQDVVNTSFAFVVSWHGPRTRTSYEYYWGLVKKFSVSVIITWADKHHQCRYVNYRNANYVWKTIRLWFASLLTICLVTWNHN